MELSLTAEDFEDLELIEHIELYCDDLKAITDADTERVAPVSLPCTDTDSVTLKKHSWNMLRFKVDAQQ
jgi:hypothetical protein